MQRRGDHLAYLKRLVFRAAVSVLVYALYSAAVWKVWYLSASNDWGSPERQIRGLLFWLLFYWSVGSFDRETWRVR